MVSIYSQMSYKQFNTLLSPLFLGFEWTSNKVDFISRISFSSCNFFLEGGGTLQKMILLEQKLVKHFWWLKFEIWFVAREKY